MPLSPVLLILRPSVHLCVAIGAYAPYARKGAQVGLEVRSWFIQAGCPGRSVAKVRLIDQICGIDVRGISECGG